MQDIETHSCYQGLPGKNKPRAETAAAPELKVNPGDCTAGRSWSPTLVLLYLSDLTIVRLSISPLPAHLLLPV